MLLQARHLSKEYLRGRWPRKTRTRVAALRDVSLEVPSQSTLAIVGRSGAGKSTLARCLCRLEIPDSGSICFEGDEFLRLSGPALSSARRRIQLVFQQSATAISPRLNALQAVAEPLRIHGGTSREDQTDCALEMMDRVALPRTLAAHFAEQLSGGQRQRLALARALVCQPKLLILDEGLAGLDSFTQARIVELLTGLQSELAISYIFITHDLSLATKLAGQIAIMLDGRIVETGPASGWPATFTHPESMRLLHAMPEKRLQAFAQSNRPS